MPKSVAIVQSNYIPWKGYFDLIRRADEFVLYDDVQYTRRDWRNRNRIKTADGTQWLTIPVEVKGKFLQRINETRISDPDWGRRHWDRLRYCYSRAPFFRLWSACFEEMYFNTATPWLSEINEAWIHCICRILGIRTRITRSAAFPREAADPSQQLLDICLQAGATKYISGPAAKAYLKEDLFHGAGIDVAYMDYSGYPEYPQLHPPFDHAVTVLDLLFMVGADAPSYLERVRHAA
jgi:hypothetical protein